MEADAVLDGCMLADLNCAQTASVLQKGKSSTSLLLHGVQTCQAVDMGQVDSGKNSYPALGLLGSHYQKAYLLISVWMALLQKIQDHVVLILHSQTWFQTDFS